MADVDALTSEWEQVLEGTLSYLRTQASAELDYAAVMRIERTAWRRSRQILAALELEDEVEAPPATDELLRSAVAPSSRQAVTEQVLGEGLVDDGPEGVADDANRELSEEISQESEPEIFADPEPLDEDDYEEIEEMDTAPPGTESPVLAASAPVADETATFEGELDLDAIEPLDTVEEIDEIPATEAEEEPPLFEEEPPQRPVEGGEPLLPDFDFDEDEEQDETVVFSLGDSGGSTGEAVARLIEEHAASQADEEEEEEDAFDLMPDLDVDEVEEELDIEPLSFDDDTDMQDPAPMDFGAASASVSTRPRSPQGVTAGLYGNPNVPTIRDTPQPAPRAAAIKINATAGTGKMMGFEEEEEPLAIGSAEDYGEDIDDHGDANFGGGFSLSIAEDDYDDDEEWEEEDSEAEVQAQAPAPPPKPVFRGPDPAQIAAVLRDAQDAAARGDMQVGVDLFSDVLDADPDMIEAYVGRGRLYLDLGDYSRAMSDFMTSEDLAPNNPEPQVAIGDLYFARKDYRKAIEYFDGALEMDPNHAMAHCRRGISHYYRKNYSDALADLKTAERMNPDIPNIGTYISMAQKKAKR